MTDPNTPGFNPGGYKDRFDSRDFQLSEVAGAAAPFDWTSGFDIVEKLRVALNNPSFSLPVKDQNGSGSCGGQAWSYLAEVLEALNTGVFNERSAKFIYAQTYVPGGGSRGRDNGDIYTKQGVARESVLTSYDNGHSPAEPFMERSQDITEAVRLDAHSDLSSAYAQVGTNGATPTIEEVATAIKNFNGVVLGISAENNGTWNIEFPKPPTKVGWRHWIFAGKAKMINGVKHIGFLNSWGIAAGNKGWQWVSEAYFNTIINGESAVFSGWTHVFNNNQVPPTFKHNFTSQISFGQSGSEVIALQKALQLDGEFPATVPTTGFFGDITRRSVLTFQLKYKLDTPAVLNQLAGKSVGPKTRAQLNILFNK